MKVLYFMHLRVGILYSLRLYAMVQVMVTVHENQGIVYMTEEQHLEQSIRETFSDIIEAGENILIQVEKNWGDCTFYVD